MKILFYNWVDIRDPEGRGGGVSLYLRNLADALQQRGGIEAYFLCSGISYDPFHGHPRVEPIRHGQRDDRHLRFDLVNSGVLAPAHHAFDHASQIDHPETIRAFRAFLDAHGPFDVVHFHNLEGLPATALALKERFPNTRVIVSLHNHYPFCPQVNLWHRERQNCTDFEGGNRCIDCLPEPSNTTDVRRANALAYALKTRSIEPGSRAFGWLFRPGMRALLAGLGLARWWSPEVRQVLAFADETESHTSAPAEAFRQRRQTFTALINEHCDRVLCVSDRVAQIASGFGVKTGLLETCRIGTRHAGLYSSRHPKRSVLDADGTITLAYLGYMRRDKGFHFLMEALASLPPELASRVRLQVCAGRGDSTALEAMHKAERHLCELRHVDGYKQEQLDMLLANAGVGVVPVQWEDSLPQVAIEMHARRIPLLTSDLGGARELGNTQQMVFRANSVESFHDRVAALLGGKIDLDAYWHDARPPLAMEGHCDRLLDIYTGAHRAAPVARARTA